MLGGALCPRVIGLFVDFAIGMSFAHCSRRGANGDCCYAAATAWLAAEAVADVLIE